MWRCEKKWSNLSEKSLEDKNMKRVLILTQPLRCNYGGLLQAFALQKIVKNLGFAAVTNSKLLRAKRKITIKKIWNFCLKKTKRVVKTILGYNIMTQKQFKIISQNTQKFIDTYIETESIEKLSTNIR